MIAAELCKMLNGDVRHATFAGHFVQWLRALLLKAMSWPRVTVA